MQATLFKEKFPLLTTKIAKNRSMDELIEFFQQKIEAHPLAGFISIFDHYEFTKAKKEHNIAEDILDVKNVIFCFGKEIPNPLVPAVRPRSIALVETQESFVITFMEAPNEKLTEVMQEWVRELS